MQIETIVVTALITAIVTGAITWLYTRGIWKLRIWRYRRNWTPLFDSINSDLEGIFGIGSMAPIPKVGIKRGEVIAARAQSYVRRSDGLRAASHQKKEAILVASDTEILQGVPFNDSLVNFIRQMLSMRGDPFLAFLSPELRVAIESFSLSQIAQDLEIESSLIATGESDDEAKVDDLAYAVEDVYNAGKLGEFTQIVAESYAGLKTSPRTRIQTMTEFNKRYSELEKEFAGLYYKTSERQLECIRNGLSGVLIPPRFQPPSRVDNWTIFFWRSESIEARAKVVAFFPGPFETLWRKHKHTLLKIKGFSTHEVLERGKKKGEE